MDKSLRSKIVFFLLCLTIGINSQAQDRSVYGRLVDSVSQKGVGSVNLINKRTGEVVASNDNGDFYIRAIKGDSLIITTFGYNRAGLKWDGLTRNPTIWVVQQAIMLQELLVLDKKYDQLKLDIKYFLDHPTDAKALRNETLKRMLNNNTSTPGIGISIDALWDMYSKEGRSKQKLADLTYNDVKKFYSELLYNKQIVRQVTKLGDEDIDDFMNFCKPTQDFILNANDYELTFKILKCLKEFRESRIYRKLR